MRLNRLRNLALIMMFVAFIVMYLSSYSTLTHAKAILLPIGLTIGTILLLTAVAIYFRLGAISIRLPQVICPHCGRLTKIMGKEDGCMFCKEPLTLDINNAGEYVVKS